MENIYQILPDEMLRRQVCQECFQYLSVLPIGINSRKEIICGRCFNDSEETKESDKSNTRGIKYVKSAYNIIAEKFLYKCTNHYDGCTKILNSAGTKEHEKTCCYEKQECFFCSFSGNLCQIFNHASKCHPENVSFDGRFSFWLNDVAFKKKLLLVDHDNIFFIRIEVVEELFSIIITPVSKTLSPTINQYGVKFFKVNEPLNFDFVHTDYGLLNINLVNYYEKHVGELVTFFAPGIQVSCQILLGQFSLDEKEAEFQQRFAKLRQSEVALNDFKQEVEAKKRKLSQQSEVYESAINVIKKMSYNLFKCCSCEKVSFSDTYYCLKMHCYCKECLKSMCKVCNTVREYTKLEDINNIRLSCDWPNCNLHLRLKDYFKHKSSCLQRPYKCPLQDCQKVVFSSEGLIEHWHSEIPTLCSSKSIICNEYGIKEYYWLLHYDLYRVLINFEANKLQVIIDEVNVLLNSITFDCMGTRINNNNQISSQILPSTMFCGQYHVNSNCSINRGYPATTVTISPK